MNGDTTTVAELAALCGAETARYLAGQSFVERFCFELFRCAVVLRDDDAWAAVYHQYRDVVCRWVGASREQDDSTVLAAFERFWRAVDAAKFARFSSLAGVLQYLKMCALSARLDGARADRHAGEASLDDGAAAEPADPGMGMEESVVARIDGTAFWARVRAVLGDEREQLVIYLSYVIGLTPRDIHARHRERFADVQEVYRLKRVALDRLRRASDLIVT